MFLCLIEFAVSVTAQSIDLCAPGESVCVGEEAVFTCKAVVTGNLMWISDCFIGQSNTGKSITIPSNTQLGLRMSSTQYPNNYALLKSVNNNTGVPELTSTLHVQVERPIDGLCTVICMTTDGLERSATVKILGNTYSTCSIYMTLYMYM